MRGISFMTIPIPTPFKSVIASHCICYSQLADWSQQHQHHTFGGLSRVSALNYEELPACLLKIPSVSVIRVTFWERLFSSFHCSISSQSFWRWLCGYFRATDWYRLYDIRLLAIIIVVPVVLSYLVTYVIIARLGFVNNLKWLLLNIILIIVGSLY